MCKHITVRIETGEYGPNVTVQTPTDTNPSSLREARDQALGVYQEVLIIDAMNTNPEEVKP